MGEFDNYKVERQIGEGAQGIVYLAKHKTIGRLVAIKSLHPELVLNNNHKERFIEEAKTLGNLNHSSIVTLYEYIANNNGWPGVFNSAYVIFCSFIRFSKIVCLF